MKFWSFINLPWGHARFHKKIWARSDQPFWRFLDTNKQTDKPNFSIDFNNCRHLCTVFPRPKNEMPQKDSDSKRQFSKLVINDFSLKGSWVQTTHNGNAYTACTMHDKLLFIRKETWVPKVSAGSFTDNLLILRNSGWKRPGGGAHAFHSLQERY